MIAYFQGFEKFITPKQVSSYMGICPSPYNSGTSINKTGSISRKGNSYLRKTIYMGALIAASHNKQCTALYTRLVLNGKNKKAAIIAVANKLIKQMFGVIKHGQEYSTDFL